MSWVVSCLHPPLYCIEVPAVFNIQEKITVHFHTQYALCTRIRVHIFFHTLRSMRPLNIREPPPRPEGTGGPSAGSGVSHGHLLLDVRG